jgi:betaine-homocysteine S-methyltransferase
MKRGLLERLDSEGVVCAEGYLFEMERRGYLTAGEFVPEVALENPDALRNLHQDFQHAGSDVIEAFTYNAHRQKMRIIEKEDLLESLNRAALRIAREVAADPGQGQGPNLFAGNISNSNIWNPEDMGSQRQVREMFEEMVGWAVDEDVDYMIGETFYYAEEAFCALEVIKQAGTDGRKYYARRVADCRYLQGIGAAGSRCCWDELFPWTGNHDALSQENSQGRWVSCSRITLSIPYNSQPANLF